MISPACGSVHSHQTAWSVLALHAPASPLSTLERCAADRLAVVDVRTTLDALWWLPRRPWLAVVLDLHVERAIPVTPLLRLCHQLAPNSPILAFAPREPDQRDGWREHMACVIVGPAELAHATAFIRTHLAIRRPDGR